MTPPLCPKSGALPDDIDFREGVSTCPNCGRTVLVVAGRIRDHRLPGRVA